MDFSPWDWAERFRLHEAACLIAGVMPLAKRVPDIEELPAQAIPALIALSLANVNWVCDHNKPEVTGYPKSKMLQAEPPFGYDKPTLLVRPEKLTGEVVSREELHRWIQAMGIRSVYQFMPSEEGCDQDLPALSKSVERLKSTTHSPAPLMSKVVSTGDDLWKETARTCAYEIIKRDGAKELYPSQLDIAAEIAKQFRQDGVYGADGKALTGAYIKRHSLKGITSEHRKQISTLIRRSK